MAAPPPKYNARHPDLSSRVGRLLDRWTWQRGRWLVYIRLDQRFPCPDCYDPTTGGVSDENDTGCATCFGTGYKVSVERLRCYVGIPENVSALAAPLSVGDWGRLDQYPGIAYIPRGVYPQKYDFLIECEWSVSTSAAAAYGTPTNILRIWKITAVLPMIYNGSSQSEFWMAGLEHHDPKKLTFSDLLISAGTQIGPPVREGLLPMQSQAESFVPDGGNTGSRQQQRDAPSNSMPANRGLGRASRTPPRGL